MRRAYIFIILIIAATVPLWGFDYTVQGVSHDMSMATLKQNGTNEKVTVYVGDQVGGFTVTQIESDAITLSSSLSEGNSNGVAQIIFKLPLKSPMNTVKAKSNSPNAAP